MSAGRATRCITSIRRSSSAASARFGDRLLLCRRAIAPSHGLWTIPAGYLENGETAEEGARREAWEEARAEIALEGLIAVYSIKRIDQVQLLYRAQLLSAEVAAGPESLEVALVDWADIPWGRAGVSDRALGAPPCRSDARPARAAGAGRQSAAGVLSRP